MACYAIGDVHGCLDELEKLLDILSLSQEDRLYFVGDLVGRGPKEWQVLERIASLPQSRVVLGNHDIHFLATYGSKSKMKGLDKKQIDLLLWLANQPLARWHKSTDSLIVHAGIWPSWSLNEA